MKHKLNLYPWLAGANLFISAFTFGGGYVVVPIVRDMFVRKKKLFSEEELTEMAAIAQSTPGAIAINMVALSGYRTAGTAGLVISCISAVIPPLIILSAVSYFYTAVISNPLMIAVLKGMQAGVAALIVDFAVNMAAMIAKERSRLLNLLIIISFVLSFFTGINVAAVLIGSCVICILQVYLKRRT